MRNYMREQPDNLKTHNIVKEVANYLVMISLKINEESIGLVTQVLESLIEFSMGNVENQQVVFDSKGKS